MRSHELAKQLLELEDMSIAILKEGEHNDYADITRLKINEFSEMAVEICKIPESNIKYITLHND
ncbi:MAG: hypothetical protein WC756_04915 [Taibaiella sp.]|jgi:hypothetical protein